MFSAAAAHKLLTFPTEDAAALSLAAHTAALSTARPSPHFTVVLSGGYLINSLRHLLSPPYLTSVDWAAWHVFWVDERVVPTDHPDSNYKLALDAFLSLVPIPPSQIHAIADSLSPPAAAANYQSRLHALVDDGVLELSPSTGFPRFDLMLLGMGPDGHIASLFPGHPLLAENQKWVASIEDSPKPPPERITFTFPVINASRNIAMVVVGGGEVDAVGKALWGKGGDSDLLPVRMVKLEEGEFVWFCDEEAVAGCGEPVIGRASVG